MTEGFDVVESRVTHDGVLARVRVDAVAMPDGGVGDREIVERPDAVAVVALTDGDEVVLVRQYRHAVGDHVLEIPAGLRDVDGEPERATAVRELSEETGLGAGDLQLLLRFHNSAGWTTEQTSVFLATDLSADPADDFVAEAEEHDMDVVRVPFDDAVAAVVDGTIRDAKTVIGLLLVAHRRAAGS